jgi:hypothetical protein
LNSFVLILILMLVCSYLLFFVSLFPPNISLPLLPSLFPIFTHLPYPIHPPLFPLPLYSLLSTLHSHLFIFRPVFFLVSWAFYQNPTTPIGRSIYQITYVTPYACRRLSNGTSPLPPPYSLSIFFSSCICLSVCLFSAVFWYWVQLGVGFVGLFLFLFWFVRKSNQKYSQSIWEMLTGCWLKPQHPTFEVGKDLRKVPGNYGLGLKG